MSADKFRSWAAPVFLVLTILLGGATAPRAGLPANALLQTLAIFLIVFGLWTQRTSPLAKDSRPLIIISGIWLLLALLYLIPLPYDIWSSMPGREPVRRGMEMIGVSSPPSPTSLDWERSIASILRLLPPAAIFILTLQLTDPQRRRLAITLVGAAAASECLGIAQLAGGPGSSLRPYVITSPGMPVGFFANGNHQATLLLCALALAGYLLARAALRRRTRQGGTSMAVASVVALFFVLGLAICGSAAGYGLLIPVGAGIVLLYRRVAAGKVGWTWAGGVGILVAAMIGLAFLGPFSEQNLSDQLSDSPISRRTIAVTTWQAVVAHFPFGSGLGTFGDVYRTYEDIYRPVTEFVNHAHNDYLEVALETGLVGVILILAFMAWFGRATWIAWRSDREGANLARAASLIIAVCLMHSLVDYPLRTSAIAVVFAAACAFLLPGRVRLKPRSSGKPKGEGLRHMEAE
jgi:O-antigen ligase